MGVTAKTSSAQPYRYSPYLERIIALRDIARHDAILADPDLYSRDPKAFDRAMTSAAHARAALDAAEMEWLELEEKKSALAG